MPVLLWDEKSYRPALFRIPQRRKQITKRKKIGKDAYTIGTFLISDKSIRRRKRRLKRWRIRRSRNYYTSPGNYETAAAAKRRFVTEKIQLGVVVVGSGRDVAVLPVWSRPGNIRHATHTKQLVFCYICVCVRVYMVKHCLCFLSTRNNSRGFLIGR